MKIIFLDIDGVMNHKEYFHRGRLHERQEFCPIAVRNLRELLKVTGAKIVVSSTWRKMGITRLRKLFACYDLRKYLIGITPILENQERGTEIEKFIQDFPDAIDDFVIIDDDDDMGRLLPHLVQTSHYTQGLNDIIREEVISRLHAVVVRYNIGNEVSDKGVK